jgi:hypothetical protein
MAALALDHPIGLDGGSAGVPVPHSSDRRRLESGKRGLIDKYDPGVSAWRLSIWTRLPGKTGGRMPGLGRGCLVVPKLPLLSGRRPESVIIVTALR